MVERHIYKGTKEWVYTKGDDKRIENEDTGSTKKFKKGYKEWLEKKQKGYRFERWVRPKRVVIEKQKSEKEFHKPKWEPPKVLKKYEREEVSRPPKREEPKPEPYKEPKKKFPIFAVVLAILLILVIFTVTKPKDCNDGTLHNTCASKKPYLCTDGLFYERPNECGCPDGERVFEDKCVLIIKCIDGTLHPECSEDKPYQCLNGTLVLKATICGCPDGYYAITNICKKGNATIELTAEEFVEKSKREEATIFNKIFDEIRSIFKEIKTEIVPAVEEIKTETKEKVEEGMTKVKTEVKKTNLERAREAHEYINELRVSNGRNPIKFDERVFELGLARAKDMSQNNYLDHTNPITGECPDNMKQDFGLSQGEYVAENAYGAFGYPAFYTEAIDSWMSSRGHRYNLLYANHVAGAPACYLDRCVFLGLNYDGFGAGCFTAEEGNAFWANQAPQPDEI